MKSTLLIALTLASTAATADTKHPKKKPKVEDLMKVDMAGSSKEVKLPRPVTPAQAPASSIAGQCTDAQGQSSHPGDATYDACMRDMAEQGRSDNGRGPLVKKSSSSIKIGN